MSGPGFSSPPSSHTTPHPPQQAAKPARKPNSHKRVAPAAKPSAHLIRRQLHPVR